MSKLTFKQFQATGRYVWDIGWTIPDCSLNGKPGRVYADAVWIGREPDGRRYLLISNEDWISADIEPLERELYAWWLSEC